MACVGIDPGNTYLWLSLAGIFLGGGLSFILAKSRRRKPAVSAVLLSVAILCFLAALAVSEFSLNNYSLKLVWLGASAVIGYLCFILWKIAGIPVLLLSVIFTSIVWFSFHEWSCAEPGTEICRFRTISEGADFLRIQYEDPDGISKIDKVEGEAVYPRLEIVSIPDYFFILKESTIYRFHGFDAKPTNSHDSADGLTDIIFGYVSGLPGFIIKNGSLEAINFSPSLEYMFLFGDDGEPEISRQI